MSTRWGWFDSISISLEITAITLSHFALLADEYMADFHLSTWLRHIDKSLSMGYYKVIQDGGRECVSGVTLVLIRFS